VSIFPLDTANSSPGASGIILQKQTITEPKNHGMTLAGRVRVQERHVYEKNRHSDQVVNPRGSCKYPKDFETYLAQNDSTETDSGLQSRRSVAHP
jgi:hypothetical protein